MSTELISALYWLTVFLVVGLAGFVLTTIALFIGWCKKWESPVIEPILLTIGIVLFVIGSIATIGNAHAVLMLYVEEPPIMLEPEPYPEEAIEEIYAGELK